MTDDRERHLEQKFWDELRASPFLMLGLQGVDDDHTRPMTAQIDGKDIWFFARRSEELVKGLAQPHRAVATFASKGHKLFACIHGSLAIASDRSDIDRLWTLEVASWYQDGKDDAELVLVRFDTERVFIWEAETGAAFKAAVVKLLGRDPASQQAEPAEFVI